MSDSNPWAALAAPLDGQEGRLARARSRSVYIGTPIARHPVRQYQMAHLQTVVTMRDLGIRCYTQTVIGNSNLPRARNELLAGFMASGYDDMLYIDDDMGWTPNDVVRLLASEREVIGAVGCKKVMRPDTDPEKWCMRALPHGVVIQDEMGAIEVEAIGTGFLKISRRVIERFIAEHPDWKRRGWKGMPAHLSEFYYQIFRFDPDDLDEMGEDIGFCMEWRRMGGSIWMDPSIRLKHVGEHEYTGDIGALLEGKES